MKQVIVIGKTEAIISLNKIGVPIRGKSTAILNINNHEQEAELMGVLRAGLLEIVPDAPTIVPPMPKISPVVADKVDVISDKVDKVEEDKVENTEKKKGGRPRGSKNKSRDIVKNPLATEELRRVSAAEAKTQQMGSRVVIGTPDGAKQGKMKRSAIDDMVESDQNRASIEAMEKLEREEKEDINLPDTPVDEGKMDASEQMGRRAIVATEAGIDGVNMVNSILPESKIIKDADPFIDREDKRAIKEAEEKQAAKKSDDGMDDAFIEI
jgi:hypothetical protein